MKDPKISICLPIFNAAAFLDAALESILSQSFEDFEVLVADDCSSDSSPEILAKFTKADSRIKCFRNEKNQGAVRNYNNCFARARGEFIKPFGADDIMHSQHLSKLIEPFSEFGEALALVSCARQVIDEHGNKQEVASSFSKSGLHKGAEIRKQSLLRFVHIFNLIGEPSCVMFRRSQLSPEGFNGSYYHMTDLDLWMSLLKDGDLFYIAEALCYYRKHKGTTTSNNFKSLYYTLDFLRLIDRNIDLANEIYGSREKAYLTVAEHLGRFLDQKIATDSSLLETISRNLLDSSNPLLLQSGIEQSESIRPETLSDEEYFRQLAFFALLKSGEKARMLDETYARAQNQEKQLESLYESVSWKSTRLLRGVAGLFRAKT